MDRSTDIEGPKELIARATSLLLLDTQAVRISLSDPFRLTSGNFSPIYINCRTIISDSLAMDLMTSFSHWICRVERVDFDVIAGGESAGIPFAGFLAQRLSKPMIYVRKKVKNHGISSLVEGRLFSGQRVLLVEDLVTDGKSKIDFLGPIREKGANVNDCLVLFDRDQGGAKLLNQAGVRLLSLTNMEKTLECALSQDVLSPDDSNEIQTYLSSPKAWHQLRNLPYQE